MVSSIAVGLAILYLSLTPGVGIPRGGDKIAHFAAYFVWTSASLMAVRSWSSSILVLAIALATGAAVEIIQPFVGRHGSLMDMVANGVGLGFGAAVAIFIMRPLDDWIGLKVSARSAKDAI
jgi:VanZ family protein